MAEDHKQLVARAMAAFRRLPEVHSVGIGGRERAGRPTGEIVLKVFVRKKRSPADLPPGAAVPPQFEGMPTDVVEAPEPERSVAPAGAKLGGPYDKDRGRYRPLRGGIQLSGAAGAGEGTLGFVCRIDEPSPERIVAMTCHHVLFASVAAEIAGLSVGQPTPKDSVTKCCRGIFGSFLKGYQDNTMDAAIVRFEKGTEYFPQIEEIGPVNSDHDITLAEAATLTYPVRKRGRTTHLTGGTVQAINAVHASGLSGYTVIKPNAAAGGATPTFADHGDSGSGVVNDANEIVGLLFAMASLTPGATQAGWGFAWPIEGVKARFAADGFNLICDSATALNEKRVAQVGGLPGEESVVAPGVEPEPDLLGRQLEQDLAASELGKSLTTLWMRHSDELNQLVGGRKIGAQWHRSGGAALFQCGLRAFHSPDVPVPAEIGGRPSDACLQSVLDLFERYGSHQLRDDIRAYREQLPTVSGRSYAQILEAMRERQKERAPWRG